MTGRTVAFIGIILVCVVCVMLVAGGIVSLGRRADNKALYEKQVIEAQNEAINRLELKLEFLERYCRWLIFLKEALPSDITAELDALAEQLKQRKEKPRG